MAGERAAGLVTHPTNSDPRHLEDTVRPALAAGAGRAGRPVEHVRLVVAPTVVAGTDDRAVGQERERQRRLLAFLYSTPAYARALERQGREDLPGRLRGLIRADDWGRLPALLTDELLDALAVVGRYDELGKRILGRFGALADGVALPPLGPLRADDAVARLVADLREPVAPELELD